MSTATPEIGRNQEQQERIRSPLVRLRSIIHRYVSLEGLGVVGLFLALWFWIGLILDYGVFKLTLFDWVQETPWGFRATVLVALILAVIATGLLTVLFRLLTQFSDVSMALLLERKFPKELGDRLITAVELSDPRTAEVANYSPAMIRHTVEEAAERVDKLPLNEVFDWKRLWGRAYTFLGLTLGFYVLVVLGFCGVRAMSNQPPAMDGMGDFHDVASIWTERNILLRNTIWPRRSYLEILPWPQRIVEVKGNEESEQVGDPLELRIPQNSAPPSLRVRAWKFVIADADYPEGWRLLTWADLQQRNDLGVGDVPSLPDGWTARDAKTGMTVDEVEFQFENLPIRETVEKLDGRWQMISAGEESGYRPLMWSDLTQEKIGCEIPKIAGSWDPKAMPAMVAPGAALVPVDPIGAAARIMAGPKYINLSVAEVETALEKVEAEIKSEGEKPTQLNKAQKLEREVTASEVRKVFDRLKRQMEIRAVVEKVESIAGERGMRRTLRKLIIPSEVTLTYTNRLTRNTSSMTRIAGNEYTANIGELKESINYNVRGEDYITKTRSITVVERPRIELLETEEERPAYLYYRTGEDVNFSAIRGQRQKLEPMKLSTSGEVTNFEVPAGTSVVLRGKLSKPLRAIDILVEAKDQKAFIGEKPTMESDGQSFTMKLNDVRRDQRFKLLFRDGDNVEGERKIVLIPKEDNNPRVREFNPDEVIRRGRGNEGLIIAAGCRIPFKGRVLDDHGLGRVRYAVRVIPADFLSEQKIRSLFGVGGVALVNPGGPTTLQGLGYLSALTKELSQQTTDEAGPEQFVDLAAFEQAVKSNRPVEGSPMKEILPLAELQPLLKSRQREPYRKLFREFNLKPDEWSLTFGETEEIAKNPSRWPKPIDQNSPIGSDLLLSKLTWRDKDGKQKPLKETDPARAQKRFIIEVRLIAEDTYLDGDLDGAKAPIPHSGASGETFTFVVVPENELLSRIAEEEETKYRELQKAFKPLEDNQKRLLEVNAALAGGGSAIDMNILNGYIARCDTLAEALKNSHGDVKGVYSTYERIVREMRVNELREDILTKVFKNIYLPLQEVSEQQFDRTYNSLIALRRTLDVPGSSVADRVAASAPKAEEAYRNLDELIKKINAILAAMEGLTKINELIAELARIEKQEEDLESLVRKIYKERIDEVLKEK